MKVKKFLLGLISSVLLLFSISFPVYADESGQYFKVIVDFSKASYGYNNYQYTGAFYSGSAKVYCYLVPFLDEKLGYESYRVYLVSDSAFGAQWSMNGIGGPFTFDNIHPQFTGSATQKKDNVYVLRAGAFAFTPGSQMDISANMPYIFWGSSEVPWDSDDFVLGDDGSGGTTSSILYDSSIPAPQNVQFKSESVGGFLGVGSKWEHTLSWSNGVSSPPLFLRVYSVAEVVFADTGQFFEDSTIPLLSADDKYNASSGRYSVGTDELSSKIMDGTVLNKVLEYRLQFCRYGDDGSLKVGPISTVHVKQNLFGKYDGYTVTTEYPKDDTDLGLSGGLDDEYKDKWTSDGEHYDDYDKDGNLVDSGTSEDSNPIQKLLNSLKNIPNIINSFFDSLMGLMSGVGQIPSFLSQLFSFLPPDIITVIGLGILLVIVLRIFGR